METRLFNSSDSHAWHAYPWPETPHLPEGGSSLAIQPVYSLAEWTLGRPLDSEELVGSEILRYALAAADATTVRRVLPPMRITPRLSVGTCFGIDVETAHRILRETLLSAAVAGHRRFLLYNTSPFLEEWIDVAARDIRIEHDLQIFCVNLSGLGLDFHPLRADTRSGLQAILTHLLGFPQEKDSIYDSGDLDPIPEAAVCTDPALAAAGQPGGALLRSVADRLADILAELDRHPPLPANSPDANHGQSS